MKKKPCLPHTMGLTHIWAHRLRQRTNNVHSFMPNGVPALGGQSRPRIPFATDICWQRGKDKIFFFKKRRIPGYINDSPSLEVVGQHKRNFMFSCCCLVSFCFLGWVLVSLFFLFVLNFIFCFFVFRELERKNRVHREGGGFRKAW